MAYFIYGGIDSGVTLKTPHESCLTWKIEKLIKKDEEDSLPKYTYA